MFHFVSVDHSRDKDLPGLQPDQVLVQPWPTHGCVGHASLPAYQRPKQWEGAHRGQRRAAYMRKHRAELKARRLKALEDACNAAGGTLDLGGGWRVRRTA